MTDNAPDVTALMEEITTSIDEAEKLLPRPNPETLVRENNLYESLKFANQSYAITAPQGRGFKAFVRKKLYGLLADTFSQIDTFHMNSLQVMNKLTKAVDGSDDDLSGELLIKTRNRMDLVEHLTHRVAQLEEQITELKEKDNC